MFADTEIVNAFAETIFPEAEVLMVTVVAPVEVSVILWLLYEPVTEALAAKRTLKEPLTEPLTCVKVAVEAYVVPLEETSYPVGAVATKFAVKLAPAIVKVCAAEAVPYVVVKAVAVAVPVINGFGQVALIVIAPVVVIS